MKVPLRLHPAIGALLFLPACRGQGAEDASPPPLVEVHCVLPEPMAVDDVVALRGRIQPPPGGDLPVASQVQGRVVTVAVREGQAIGKGDLVATVDDAASRDAVRQADATVEQARAGETNAQATLARTRALVARGIAAKQELDDAVAREEAAAASVNAVAASADLARRTLGRVQVRSSFAGVVTHLWRGPGALVDGTAATPIVQLAAQGALDFVADATEHELGRVREDQRAHGTLTDSGDTFDGVVRARSTALDRETGLGSVRISVTDTKMGPAMGAFGRVVITLLHREGVAVVPSAALRGAIADGSEVLVCKDGHAELRKIDVGFHDEAHAEVRSGLHPGERVAVDHVLGLDDGTPLKVLP
jgi:RND family efflux transporter MFP subunit